MKKSLYVWLCLLGATLAAQAQAPNYTISTYAGDTVLGYAGDGNPALQSQFRPSCMTFDSSGNLYISDAFNDVVREIGTNGIISTVAGNGIYGYYGDGGPANQSELASPCGLAFDQSGDLFIADTGNNVIREVTPGGNIVTAYGSNVRGYSGDGGPANQAALYSPTGLAMDASGNLYISDSGNNVIRVISNNTINTYAGQAEPGYTGDGGQGFNAQFYYPKGIVLDASHNLYIADFGNNVIRVIAANGIVTTVAGNGTSGFYGDGGPATSAELASPYDMAVDGAGNLYIADLANQRVREVLTSGTIVTIAGNGTHGYSGDGGPATAAQLWNPGSVVVNSQGDVLVGDWFNNVIRELVPASASPFVSPLRLPR